MATTDRPQAGFMGILEIGSNKVRVNSFNVNPEQSPQFYDHTIGLRDNIPTGLFGAKGDKAYADNPQKTIYRPGVISVAGSVTFPLQEEAELDIFNLAKTGDDFNMTFYRDCNHAMTYSYCKISQYQLSMTAGDVPNVNFSVMALDATETDGTSPGYISTKRLVTWDACTINGTDFENVPVLSFDMTIANECHYIYTAGENVTRVLKPAKIRVGLQSVQGTITFYTKGYNLNFMKSTYDQKEITVKMNGKEIKINCVYVPVKRAGQPGAITSTLQYFGVGSYWVKASP